MQWRHIKFWSWKCFTKFIKIIFPWNPIFRNTPHNSGRKIADVFFSFWNSARYPGLVLRKIRVELDGGDTGETIETPEIGCHPAEGGKRKSCRNVSDRYRSSFWTLVTCPFLVITRVKDIEFSRLLARLCLRPTSSNGWRGWKGTRNDENCEQESCTSTGPATCRTMRTNQRTCVTASIFAWISPDIDRHGWVAVVSRGPPRRRSHDQQPPVGRTSATSGNTSIVAQRTKGKKWHTLEAHTHTHWHTRWPGDLQLTKKRSG